MARVQSAHNPTFWKMLLPTAFSWMKKVWQEEAWAESAAQATGFFRSMISGMLNKLKNGKK